MERAVNASAEQEGVEQEGVGEAERERERESATTDAAKNENESVEERGTRGNEECEWRQLRCK